MTAPRDEERPAQPAEPLPPPPPLTQIGIGGLSSPRAQAAQAPPAGGTAPAGQTVPPPAQPVAPAQPTARTITPAQPAPRTVVPPQPAPAEQAASARNAVPGSTATGTATRAVATATVPRSAAAPLAAPIAIADTDRQDPPGTVFDTRRPPEGNGHRIPSGRLTRLRIGSHTASRTALAQLRISSPGTGLILGADRQQRPVSTRFFRPTPYRSTLVGGGWAGQLVAFRALALGARVAVITAEPHAWHSFGERSTGRSDRVAILTAEQPLALPATAQQPALIIYDLGLAGARAPQPLGPWQTQLTIVRQLDQSGVSAIQDCDLVLLQRLASDEAALVSGVLRLSAQSTRFLQVMPDDMVALIGDGAQRYIWFAQTDVERQYTGAPRR